MSESIKPRLEVCMSPALLHLYDVKDSIVVIIDVLRATSTICTALYNGATRIIPVAEVAECVRIGQALGAITAGERDGKIAEGLQYGNSPFEYPRPFIEGKTLVLTTTNGTKLLHMAKDAKQIITGSFPNLSAVCDYLVAQRQPVILGCSAWKDRVNMEDTLFAGAVVNRIRDHFQVNCDSALLAEGAYLAGKDNLFEFMRGATHFKRLFGFGLEGDIRYCLTPDGANVLPRLINNELVAYRGQEGM
ncbi:MAG TPA: 2-phosphosulfolactate phosphatase [Chitinophaga sp.]